MGRVMRAAPGERGMDYEHRTKKAGNIFFMVDDSSCIDKENSLKRFAMRYYGMECTDYGEGFTMPAEMTQEIESTKQGIIDRIDREHGILSFFIKTIGQSIKSEAETILAKTDKELYGLEPKNTPEYHLLDNRGLLEFTEREIKKVI